jgi:hexosaminidase
MNLLAKQNNLLVIPLVQTFGHFEFVLKHDKFRHLRELDNCPMALCSLHVDALPLISRMIDQVIRAHPDISWFHIGADEVFHVGLCEKCEQYMKQKDVLPVDLFLSHVRRVVDYLQLNHPSVRIIMWDDMFRGIDLITLQDCGIGSMVDVMVWFYQTTFTLPPDIWSRYGQVFRGLWVASAFKGATGPCAVLTDIGYHVENHKEWLNVVSTTVRPLTDKFHGFALTGWQRYDHYSVLCELLPVALPSLAICLLTFTTGAFTRQVHEMASKDLNFAELIPVNPFKCVENEIAVQCQFPGHEVYRDVHTLLRLKAEYKFFMKNDRMKGWMTTWHVMNNFTNPVHLSHFLPHGQRLLQSLIQLKIDLDSALSTLFTRDTVDEWLTVNVDVMLNKLSTVVSVANRQIELGARPRSIPLPNSDSMET